MGGADPVYEQVGPFDYDITYTREVIELNKDAGTLKYSESKVYTCAEDTRTPCDMEVTTTNIPFQPQVVGATGTAISGIMDATKAGFSAGVMAQDLNTTQAGKQQAISAHRLCWKFRHQYRCYMWIHQMLRLERYQLKELAL